jgi:hypothetical protein
MEWINVNENRPELTTWVLCLCSKGSYWLGFRVNGGWYIDTNYGQKYIGNEDTLKITEIIYWLPLPELPTELFIKLFPDEKR